MLIFVPGIPLTHGLQVAKMWIKMIHLEGMLPRAMFSKTYQPTKELAKSMDSTTICSEKLSTLSCHDFITSFRKIPILAADVFSHWSKCVIGDMHG
jgi:hypothetical protein